MHPNAAAAEAIARISGQLDDAEATLDARQGRAPSLAEQRELRAVGDKYASVYRDLGLNQPLPAADETPLHYKARNLSGIRQWSERFKDADTNRFVTFGKCGAIDEIEREVIEAARRRADDRTKGQVGAPDTTLRQVTKQDEHGNLMIEHMGNPAAWMSRFMPAAESFLTAVGDGRRALAGEFK